jgi:hypothetical protein
MKTRLILSTLLAFGLGGCILIGAGTLGGFDKRIFPVPKESLVRAITLLYEEHPEYHIPPKWQQDDWKKRGYDFLDTRIFYFSAEPEEMYYVSFIGDSIVQADPNRISISIRSVYTASGGWQLEENFGREERERIEKRFNREIITKLEEYTGTHALRGK